MIKTKFVFAISMVSILAVNVANAKIAATSYVDEGVQTATDAAGAAQISADTANTAAGKAQKSADDAQESADAAAESAALALTTLTSKEDRANKVTSFDDGSASDEKYPSTSAVKKYVSSATSAINTDIDTVKTALGGKQATISDLATIRSGAAAGATALQKADITTGTSNGTISVDGTNVAVRGLGTAAYTASTAYATAAQGTLADSAVQPGDLAEVATSGSYNDLSNKPTIPTVNNATLTIQKNGTTVDTFTANSSANKTINITVPTGALASKSTITNADVADNAAIAASKIGGLATVATSGSYKDLSDKPTIPTVNNATLTIKNGATNTNLATFTANQSSAATATIPAATPSVAGLSKIGVIPSGSATSTTYATIWVE